jgi:hypothetical protein
VVFYTAFDLVSFCGRALAIAGKLKIGFFCFSHYFDDPFPYTITEIIRVMGTHLVTFGRFVSEVLFWEEPVSLFFSFSF